jgi:hypothetical protein
MTSPEIKKSMPTNHVNEYHELTTEYIILIHDEAIESFGGEKGFLSISNVDHLIYLFNNRKYDVVKKAALALDLITAKQLKIAKYECTVEDIIGWLKKNVSPLHMG